MRQQRGDYYHYKRSYNVPRVWQEHIYTIGRLYYLRKEYARLVDAVLLSTSPNYYNPMKACIVRGYTVTKASIDFCCSRTILYQCLKLYYQQMYKVLTADNE